MTDIIKTCGKCGFKLYFTNLDKVRKLCPNCKHFIER